jgi:uncharacterized protein YndB with AHSA1/START domain
MSNAVKPGSTITLSRVFDAPRALVFETFVKPEHFRAWWGPAGSDNGETRLDPRPGGEVFVQMRGEGFDHPMGGEFESVEPPSRIVFLAKAFKGEDGDWQIVNRTTATFEEVAPGKTRVTVHVVVQKASLPFEVPQSDMEAGWNGSLDRLHDLLAKIQA